MHDVAIIGGGVAGLTAALRALQLGLRPIVLERGTTPKYECTTRYTGGVYHVAQQAINAKPETLLAAINANTGGTADPALAKALANDFPRAVAWIRELGVKLLNIPNDSNAVAGVVCPPRAVRTGVTWEAGRGGDVLLSTLTNNLKKLGGDIMLGYRADSLIMENGACRGVNVATADGEKLQCRAVSVILADGGYQGDPALLKAHIGPSADRLLQRNAGTATGDGLRMAVAAGAATAGMDSGFYGHLLARDALQISALWPFPILDRIAISGIVVGPDGRRLADEGRGGIYLSNILAQQFDPQAYSLIFAQVTWENGGRSNIIPVNPSLMESGGELYQATTLAELAGALSIDPAGLEQTIAAYNAALAAGSAEMLAPPRTTTKAQVPPLESPYYAIRIVPGITVTVGGIAIDPDARVKRVDGSVIPGLFAVGSTTGGLDGGPYYGWVGGLGKATVFGLRAAEAIAKGRAQ